MGSVRIRSCDLSLSASSLVRNSNRDLYAMRPSVPTMRSDVSARMLGRCESSRLKLSTLPLSEVCSSKCRVNLERFGSRFPTSLVSSVSSVFVIEMSLKQTSVPIRACCVEIFRRETLVSLSHCILLVVVPTFMTRAKTLMHLQSGISTSRAPPGDCERYPTEDEEVDEEALAAASCAF